MGTTAGDEGSGGRWMGGREDEDEALCWLAACSGRLMPKAGPAADGALGADIVGAARPELACAPAPCSTPSAIVDAASKMCRGCARRCPR